MKTLPKNLKNLFTSFLFVLLLTSCLSTKTPTANAQSSNQDIPSSDCTHNRKEFRCVKFIRNYDGDTLTVELPGIHPFFGEDVKVRVRGVDTPEKQTSDKCEKEVARIAQRLVENLLKRSQKIHLLNIDKDKYFRVLADVEFDGRSLKEVLIQEGLAYEYYGGKKTKTNWCDFQKNRQNKNNDF